MQKNLFEKVLDRVFSGVYFIDRDRRIIYWNNGAQRITGYKNNLKILSLMSNLRFSMPK